MRRWEHTLAIAQAVLNWGGPRDPKRHQVEPLGAMHEKVFPEYHDKPKPSMPLEEYRRRMRKVDERMRARYGEE